MKNIHYLRAFSILFIIIGHCFLQIGDEFIGRFCGYLFVQIFFIISAFLLGLKYGEHPIEKQFLINRYKRLSFVYYPYLTISILTLVCFYESVGWEEIITHFTYTNYLFQSHINGVSFGHLWYMSIQMICYVMIAILCMPVLFEFSRKLVDSIGRIICFVLFVLIISYVFTLFKIPCRIPIVLSSYLVIFLRAREILNWFDKLRIDKKKNVFIWTLFLIINAITLLLFFYWNLNEKLLIRDILILITAISWMMLFMVPLRNIKDGKIIGFISGISFELYLVHHPLIFGQFSWLNEKNGTGNIYLNIICLPVVIITLAWLLNRVGRFVSSLFVNKKEMSNK